MFSKPHCNWVYSVIKESWYTLAIYNFILTFVFYNRGLTSKKTIMNPLNTNISTRNFHLSMPISVRSFMKYSLNAGLEDAGKDSAIRVGIMFIWPLSVYLLLHVSSQIDYISVQIKIKPSSLNFVYDMISKFKVLNFLVPIYVQSSIEWNINNKLKCLVVR